MKALAAMWILVLLEFLLIDISLIFKISLLLPIIIIFVLSGWVNHHKSFWSRHGIKYEEKTQ